MKNPGGFAMKKTDLRKLSDAELMERFFETEVTSPVGAYSKEDLLKAKEHELYTSEIFSRKDKEGFLWGTGSRDLTGRLDR